MNYATISADIVAYTALDESERRALDNKITTLISTLNTIYLKQKFYARVIKGDYIECAIAQPKYIFRIALILKTLIKSFSVENDSNKRIEKFLKYGIRMAVAVAPLDKFSINDGIIDGQAIYLSGRAIKNTSTENKERIIIKDTMLFLSNDHGIQDHFEVIFFLIDTMLNNCTAKQSEILFYKLLKYTEKEIVKKTGKYQSTINQHSNSANWPAINKAVKYFEEYFK